MIAAASDHAARRFLEFFAATIRNKNTRMAYYRAVLPFFAWCEAHQLGQLVEIEPLHVTASIEGLQQQFAKPSVKQHLAAIQMLFDWLVTGGVVATSSGACGARALALPLRLLLDSRVVDVPMAYNPTFVMLSSLKPLFFNSLKNES